MKWYFRVLIPPFLLQAIMVAKIVKMLSRPLAVKKIMLKVSKKLRMLQKGEETIEGDV